METGVNKNYGLIGMCSSLLRKTLVSGVSPSTWSYGNSLFPSRLGGLDTTKTVHLMFWSKSSSFVSNN